MKKVIVALIIFALFVILFFPARLNVQCEVGGSCPQINRLVFVSEAFTNPRFVGINYFYLLVELVVSYIFSLLIARGYERFWKN